MEDDGLIHAGSGLDQITWMDVRVGDWVATPRHGNRWRSTRCGITLYGSWNHSAKNLTKMLLPTAHAPNR